MPTSNEAATIALGDFVLDLGARALIRNGRIVEMRAKSFALLCHLARHPGRVLSKDELMDAVWPDVAVTEDSLTQAIRDIRVCLGDEAAALLRTVARRGYVLDVGVGPAQDAPASAFPRIAVLPFDDRTGVPVLAPVVAIIRDEIASGLARFKTLTVLARHSVETAVRLSPEDHGQVARMLGADYLVEGTAWPGSNGFLLSIVLTDSTSGAITWSDKFDCAGDRVLDLRENVPQLMVGHLFSSLETDASARAERRPTDSLTAFEHFARGIADLRAFQSDADRAALAHFQRAVEADPRFGLAHAHIAIAEIACHGYVFAPSDVKDRACDQARRATLLAPGDARCHSTFGWLLAMRGEYEAAERSVRLAMRLNPSDSEVITDAATVLGMRGRFEEALDLIDRAHEINPLPPPWFETIRYDALHLLGRYAEAAESLARLPELNGMRSLRMAALQLKAGREAEARRFLARARSLLPEGDWIEWAREAWNMERPEDLARLLGDIRDVIALEG